MSRHPTYDLLTNPNAITNHPTRYANHPDWFTNVAPIPPPGGGGTSSPFTPIAGPDPTGALSAANRWLQNNGGASPGNAFAPDPNAPYNPALFASFMRHKYWMDNAKNRGDDTANYGAGPMRTMAF